MQSRRDQLHAYRFLTRRAVSAVVTGDADVAESPMRRISLTTVSGVMIAIVVAAGAFVLGLLKPGTTDAWKKDGTIVVERETGARYVLRDNTLYPTVNYASAVLAIGGSQPPTVTLVARSKLASVKRGNAIGIVGLPDSLPGSSGLIRSGWTVCSQEQSPDKGRSQVKATVYLGNSSPALTAQPASDGFFVRTVSTHQEYLLWEGRQFRIDDIATVTALGLSAQQPLPVSTAFINAFPVGPVLGKPRIEGAGSPGPTVGGKVRTVGEVLHTSTGHQYLVISPAKVASVDAFYALLAGQGQPGASQSEVTDSDVAGVLDQTFQTPRYLPNEVPRLNKTALDVGGFCVDLGTGGQTATAGVLTAPPAGLVADSTLTESANAQRGVADQVVLPPGKAILVKQADAPSAYSVVAGTGQRFSIAAGLLGSFGWQPADAFEVPANLAFTIPAGPAMDPVGARTPPAS